MGHSSASRRADGKQAAREATRAARSQSRKSRAALLSRSRTAASGISLLRAGCSGVGPSAADSVGLPTSDVGVSCSSTTSENFTRSWALGTPMVLSTRPVAWQRCQPSFQVATLTTIAARTATVDPAGRGRSVYDPHDRFRPRDPERPAGTCSDVHFCVSPNRCGRGWRKAGSRQASLATARLDPAR